MNRLILADNQAIFRAGAARVLALEDDMRIVAQCEDMAKLWGAIDRAAESIDGPPKLGHIFALSDNAHIVLKCQDTCRASPEYCLVIRQNESVHRFLFSPAAGSFARTIPSSAGGHYRKIMSTIRTMQPHQLESQPEP